MDTFVSRWPWGRVDFWLFRGRKIRDEGRWVKVFPEKHRAVYVLVNGFLSIAVLALVAMCAGTPFIFPSLGPTAYLLFSAPLAAASSPRNTLCGHAVGIVCGFLALLLTGLTEAPSVMEEAVNLPRVAAAALSLSLTGALMIWWKLDHAPAGATTLIVSLGFITAPHHLVIIETAVLVLVVQALTVNRLAGIPYPWWRAGAAP